MRFIPSAAEYSIPYRIFPKHELIRIAASVTVFQFWFCVGGTANVSKWIFDTVLYQKYKSHSLNIFILCLGKYEKVSPFIALDTLIRVWLCNSLHEAHY